MPCAQSAGATATSCQQAHEAPSSANADDSNASAMDMLVIAIAVLALINMAALMSAAWWLRERRRQAHAWAILVLTANAALTLTDQMGWIDTLFLALTLAALVIVLIRTRWYWGRAARRAHRQGQRA